MTVVDDPTRERLVVTVDGAEAQLLYRREPDRFVVLHTEVPEALGGRGIGGELVQAAVERAAAEGRTLVPWCPYARSWLEKHPDAAATVAIDWATPPP